MMVFYSQGLRRDKVFRSITLELCIIYVPLKSSASVTQRKSKNNTLDNSRDNRKYSKISLTVLVENRQFTEVFRPHYDFLSKLLSERTFNKLINECLTALSILHLDFNFSFYHSISQIEIYCR